MQTAIPHREPISQVPVIIKFKFHGEAFMAHLRPKRHTSARRSEPRAIHGPPSLTSAIKPAVDPHSEGALTFRRESLGFSETIESSKLRNQKYFEARYPNELSRIKELIDLQYALASHYFWLIDGFGDARLNEAWRILTGVFGKNLIALHTSLELTRCGLYGPARPHIRYALEGLIVAKLCALDPMSDAYDKWLDGLHINFTNDVLQRIAHPTVAEFKQFWSLCSSYTHATIYAMQPSFAVKDVEDDVQLNIVYLQMLLIANHHLLNRHIITPSMRYYQAAFIGLKGLQLIRERLKILLRDAKSWMGASAKGFVRDYTATWRLA